MQHIINQLNITTMDEKEKARKIKAFQERIAYLEANINKLTDFGKWDLEYSKNALKNLISK